MQFRGFYWNYINKFLIQFLVEKMGQEKATITKIIYMIIIVSIFIINLLFPMQTLRQGHDEL